MVADLLYCTEDVARSEIARTTGLKVPRAALAATMDRELLRPFLVAELGEMSDLERRTAESGLLQRIQDGMVA